MEDHLTKVNNKKIIFPESVRTVVDDLGAIGEKQLETFVSDRLVVSKVPISQRITLNTIEIWSWIFSIQICIEENEFGMWTQKRYMAKELFEHEINNIPQNYIMAQKLNLLNDLIHQLMWFYHLTKKLSLPS